MRVLRAVRELSLGPEGAARALSDRPSRVSINVRCDNESGMRALIRHLVTDHGYRSLAFLSGHPDSPDNQARARAFEAQALACGAEIHAAAIWHGDYSASGGAR